MDIVTIVDRLKSKANPENVKGMARFGINPEGTLGVSIPEIRALAKEIGKNHSLALELWATGIHEARLLAVFIDDPEQVDASQMEAWVADFDSWDVCDQACGDLFDKTSWAYQKAEEWSSADAVFIKRAGFVMMARLAVHDKKAPDEKFLDFLPSIKRESIDDRNFVKKAVNWALRQIGKRNMHLNKAAIKTAKEIRLLDSAAARWIAANALKELSGKPVQRRLLARQ